MTSRKPFLGGNFKHQYLPHYSIFFGQNVTNVISGTYRTFWHIFQVCIFDEFFKAGLVPLSDISVAGSSMRVSKDDIWRFGGSKCQNFPSNPTISLEVDDNGWRIIFKTNFPVLKHVCFPHKARNISFPVFRFWGVNFLAGLSPPPPKKKATESASAVSCWSSPSESDIYLIIQINTPPHIGSAAIRSTS